MLWLMLLHLTSAYNRSMSATDLTERIERLLGRRVVSWRTPTGGYTSAERYVLSFEDGSSAFAKAATTPLMARWLRSEHRSYSELSGNFMARMLAWDDDSEMPLLVMEDLSAGYWPPPWRPGDVERVLMALETLHGTQPPAGLEPISRERFKGWPTVAREPEAFLQLGLVSKDWLDRCLPPLLEAEAEAPFEGSELLHVDVRSDNICLLEDRVVFVDWDNTCLGNGSFDLAAWLPSLHAEGGPAPWSISPGAGEFASAVSGYFAARAGLPPIPTAPEVRTVQLQQLITALPWAIRELGLPTPRLG